MKPPAHRFLVFVALVALGPSLVRLSTTGSVPEEEEEQERIPRVAITGPTADIRRTPAILAKVRPRMIFIGDSMLNTRLDIGTFIEESGITVSRVSHASTATAVWYLYLKNIIAPMEEKPKVVVIFFRDRFLTWPYYRTTGIYRTYFESLKLGPEPIVERVIGNAAADPPDGVKARFEHAVRQAYGITYQPAFVHAKLTDLAFDITGFGVGKATRRSQMAIRFGLENLRRDLPDDLGSDTSWDSAKSPLAFTSSPDASFLPHMFDLAREQGFTLCFYRVKRRCDVEDTRGDDPQLVPYLSDLAFYLKKNGAILIDESADPIPAEWYSDGDHIGNEFRPDYTRLFWKKVRPVLEPLVSGKAP